MKSSINKILLRVSAAAVALIATVGSHAQEQPNVDVALNSIWWGNIPIMVAIDNGYFKEQGLQVEMKDIRTSGDRIPAMMAGSVAWSNLGRVAVISEMARNNKSFYYIANIDDSPGNEGCWARPGFDSFPSLRGKKIAANASAEVTLSLLLENAGMTIKDVQFVNLPGSEMAGAIAKGDVDAACVWEPLLTKVKEAVPNGKLLGLDSDTSVYKRFGTAVGFDMVVISRKLVDQHPDLAKKLAMAMFKGVDATNKEPEKTANTVAHYFRVPTNEVVSAMNTFKFYGKDGFEEHSRRQTEQMQFLAQWLFDNGKIPRVPNVKEWENITFLK